ncbi:LysR family transcriptional regulator [Vibrio owensii]|uniref:LysR family transcriptional regulator n=1 Tax=Vibrio owensii TaxID=696485 RepID=A0AAP9GIH7_9VIBR|nr:MULTISPECIES: LysR family transcriptional regulator [Vibrio]AYO18365.1 LysR family transcriptional regulator [Vibrio owensii]EKM23944.1 bacterial regulatory helix-turn-helix, lysR family protein [Vibrio sp. HENC-03]QGH50407.1 LysR family transcriptional regulator [Vibrio owensii]QLK49538.1 LysR family transcriptional regulator [Vibrio owensii]
MIGFDYNLLKVLSVILETQNTTVAAERLCTSQPAVSRNLRKIRELFNDDILVRKGAVMELTPKAEELKTQLSGLIHDIEALVNTEERFDPSTEKANLRIAINASIAQWFSAPLTQFLAKEAPLMNLVIEDWTEATPEKIDAGEIAFGINYFPMDLPKFLVQKKGGKDHFALAGRIGHPLEGKRVQLDDLKAASFAVHIIPHWNEKEVHISRLLHPLSVVPRIQLRTSHINTILNLVSESDILFPCSKYLIEQLDARFVGLDFAQELPTLEGNFGYVYSTKRRNEPMTQWLNQSIESLMAELGIRA